MRRLLTLFDRTAVLAVGVIAGFAIGLAFNDAGREQVAGFFLPSPEHRLAPPTPGALRAAETALALPVGVDRRVAARVAADGFLRVGVFGDSFGDGVWAALYDQLPTKRQFHVLRFSKEATGFTRYRTLNLEDRARAQVREHPIDVAVICFGANDTQAIYVDGHLHPLMSAGWQEIIGARIDRFVAAARASGAAVFWVGLPVMRDPRLDEDVRAMNAFYKQRMAALGVPFVDTRARSADAQGRYAAYLEDGAGGPPRLARANDGVHMTFFGYERLTSGLASRLRDYAALVRGGSGAGATTTAPVPVPALPKPRPKSQPTPPRITAEEADRRATARANRKAQAAAVPETIAPAPTPPRRRPGTLPRAAPREAVMGLLAAVALQAALSGSPCTRLCDADRLRPWFDRLAAASHGSGAPVRILQIGDSHTAGDQITGSWRTLLQAGHGSGGRGVLAPGRPYAGYLTRGITATQSAGWSVDGIFGAAWRGEGGAAKGVAQYSLTATADGASMALSADAGELFDRFTVCALARPGAGTLVLRAGGAAATVALDRPAAPLCSTITSPALTASASLSVTGGPVTITSWSTERSDGGGVVLSNLGTVGAQLTHLARTDEVVLAAELQAYRPDLLVIAFGTNEAFSPTFTATGFEATLRAQVARLRRDLPDVPVLLLGAPDSGTRQPALQAGALPCPAWPYEAPVAAIPGATLQPLPPAANWSPTARLPVVQAIQARIAHDLGLAFWSWSGAMGGRCTANAWATATPPLMRGDHVHFTSAGGAEIARRLQADLDAAAGAR